HQAHADSGLSAILDGRCPQRRYLSAGRTQGTAKAGGRSGVDPDVADHVADGCAATNQGETRSHPYCRARSISTLQEGTSELGTNSPNWRRDRTSVECYPWSPYFNGRSARKIGIAGSCHMWVGWRTEDASRVRVFCTEDCPLCPSTGAASSSSPAPRPWAPRWGRHS